MPTTQEVRRPYRIIRGQYSRREGSATTMVDPETNKPIPGRKSRKFVHYMARTPDNPNARDEIELSDSEARAFGLNKLQRLIRHDVKTGSTPEDIGTVQAAANPFEGKDKKTVVEELLKAISGISGEKQLRDFKELVHNARVLTKPMPRSREALADALRAELA